MECANLVVERYGVRRFLADVDRDRQFWRDVADEPCAPARASGRAGSAVGAPAERHGRRETVVGAALTWAADEGFEQVTGGKFESAHQWRQRHSMIG